MYDDNNLIAGIRPRMEQAISASIGTLFTLIGYPGPFRRRNAFYMEKFLDAQCSYEKKQLYNRLNTRSMALGMIVDKKAEIRDEL
eukprot:15346710-Ditylum_brightwellii.AAC.1